jgi:hypothetical protein
MTALRRTARPTTPLATTTGSQVRSDRELGQLVPLPNTTAVGSCCTCSAASATPPRARAERLEPFVQPVEINHRGLPRRPVAGTASMRVQGGRKSKYSLRVRTSKATRAGLSALDRSCPSCTIRPLSRKGARSRSTRSTAGTSSALANAWANAISSTATDRGPSGKSAARRPGCVGATRRSSLCRPDP